MQHPDLDACRCPAGEVCTCQLGDPRVLPTRSAWSPTTHMTLPQAAATIGCTMRTVWNMVRDGRLPRGEDGPPVRYRGKAVPMVESESVWQCAAGMRRPRHG